MNKKSWFDNKKCELCGKQGTTFRLIKGRHYILCDDHICDYKTRIRAGYFSEPVLNIKGVK